MTALEFYRKSLKSLESQLASAIRNNAPKHIVADLRRRCNQAADIINQLKRNA